MTALFNIRYINLFEPTFSLYVYIAENMGRFYWQDIPLRQPRDIENLDYEIDFSEVTERRYFDSILQHQ